MIRVQKSIYTPRLPKSIRNWGGVLTHTHTYSSRFSTDKRSQAPGCYEHIAHWCRRNKVRAIAMGSPYTRETAKLYAFFGNSPKGRKRYYGGNINQDMLRHPEALDGMLEQANMMGKEDVLFFLDNETPKGRYGHLWWIGYTSQFPAWHDYDQPFNQWMTKQMLPGDDSDEPMEYSRRPYREIVATQRQAGALGFWAHPTSWWFSGEDDQQRFVPNIAAEMPSHCMADGFLDGMVVMGYHPWRPEYVAVWEALLDLGYRAPAVAEMDIGLYPKALDATVDILQNYISPGYWNAAQITEAFRAGRVCASSGPFLNLTLDETPMGSVARTAPHMSHQICIEAAPAPDENELGCIELVSKGGEVIWRKAEASAGRYELTVSGKESRDYCYVRAFGKGVSAAPSTHTPQHAAISNPVYLHPRGQTFTPPLQTEAEITWRGDSPWRNGRLIMETPEGQPLAEFSIDAPRLELTAPANGRFRLIAPDGRELIKYLINVNPRLQDVQRYLYRGRFLKDFNVQPGEVPVKAWRLNDYRRSMEHVQLEL